MEGHWMANTISIPLSHLLKQDWYRREQIFLWKNTHLDSLFSILRTWVSCSSEWSSLLSSDWLPKSVFRTPLTCYDALIMFHQEGLPHPSRTLFQPEVQSKAVIKQAFIEEISPWVSQNALRRGITTGREHLSIGFNHVLEFAQELQVHIGSSMERWALYGMMQQGAVASWVLLSQVLHMLQKWNGRNMGLFKLAEEWLTKAQIELNYTLTLAVVKELLTEVKQFLWAGHEMDPVFSFSWAAQFVVSPPLSHGVLMLRCWDSNFQNWSFCIPKLVDPLESCSWVGQ